jgi:hypothetical protein
MGTDQLRQLADDLRKQAAEEDARRMTKCAQVLSAARALALLKGKIHG